MPLDMQAKEVIRAVQKIRSVPLNKLTPEEARDSYRKLISMASTAESVARIENKTMSTIGSEHLKVRIYVPEGNGPFPILLYFHGGGWVLGDLENADVPCRSITNLAKCVVVSVDYRLSPEYMFPNAVNDCYAAFKWTIEHAHTFKGNKDRIAVGGDSAGGNLAAAVTLIAREKSDPTIKFQLLVYPVTNLSTFETATYIENGEGYYLTKDNMIWYKNHYIKPEDTKNPLASPLLAENLTHLPPALIITAEYDPLRDDGNKYANRLKEHGVPTEYVCFEGMIHGFFFMGGAIDKGKEAIKLASDRLRSSLYK